MMSAISSVILKVPEELREEFNRHLIRMNYSRLLPVTLVVYVFEWIIYYLRDYFLGVGPVVLIYIVFNTVMIPLMYFCRHHRSSQSDLYLKYIIFIYAACSLLFGMALVIYTQPQVDIIYVYLMFAVGVAAFVVLYPLESFLLFLLSTLFFIWLLPLHQTDAALVFVEQFDVAVFMLCVWFLSRNIFKFTLKDFLSQKELEAKNQQLQAMLRLDAMTGLLNHKVILDVLANEQKRAKRYPQPLTITLFDIDDFKKVNDTYGHQSGDDVLIQLSDMLKEMVRETDYVGRYGGEEFLVILPNTDNHSARLFNRRLQEKLKSIILPGNKHITVSGGTACFENEDISQLIAAADRRLYQAKRRGKNCFIDTDLTDSEGDVS